MIIGFLEGIIELAILGASGLFLVRDYRNGFPRSKAMIEWVSTGLRLHTPLSNTEKAQKLVETQARGVGMLRDALASIQAEYRLNMERAETEETLALEFSTELDRFIKSDDVAAQRQAASFVVNHRERTLLFRNFAEDQIAVARQLRNDLDFAEMELDRMKTTVETIRLSENVSIAKRQMITLVSDVDSAIGLPTREVLNMLLLDTRREEYTADALLQMGRKDAIGRGGLALLPTKVLQEMEAARDRLSLPDNTIVGEA